VGFTFSVVADGSRRRWGGRIGRIVGKLAFLGGLFQTFYFEGLGGGQWWKGRWRRGRGVGEHGLDGFGVT